MKILHTADWHLGKRLENFSRLEEQKLVMNELVEIADAEDVDLVFVAGDLFDNFNPSTEAVELFYRTLKQLSKNGKRPVVAIAGNHDSPDRIDAPIPLAKECGIILIGHPNAEIPIFELEHFKIINTDKGFIELKLNQFDYPIRIIHTAYANEIRLKEYLGEDNKEVALSNSLQNTWQNLADTYCDENGINVLMAHLYMMKRGAEKPEEPEGEKPIMIGNADLLYTEIIPSQIQYTALGHLHNFRNIGTLEKPVVYSSSSLCYSFSEAGQKKFVNIIDLKPAENPQTKTVEIKSGKPLFRKTFDEVEKALDWLKENSDSLVELTFESDKFLKTEDRQLMYQANNGFLRIIPKLKNDIVDLTQTDKSINLNQDIQDLFKDYFKSKNQNQEPNDELMNIFKELI
ncbi:exonuclease subunit SbcD [Epilithonimonas sp. JDS]|uniref:metallophosphoesterase family protein n=1 Tax=Epilithonimonas sp. JDS TaxID=2902797 RepID=UPI001E38FDE5|nr:exonuclease subunit SbcD [Epilithonimonas sp. JDS]MCD9853768.1 exonuclease subunit SbcD [Epilithonimonas sp. JDS]